MIVRNQKRGRIIEVVTSLCLELQGTLERLASTRPIRNERTNTGNDNRSKLSLDAAWNNAINMWIPPGKEGRLLPPSGSMNFEPPWMLDEILCLSCLTLPPEKAEGTTINLNAGLFTYEVGSFLG